MLCVLVLLPLQTSADDLPPGSWRDSAENAHMEGHTLVADLRDGAGGWERGCRILVEPGMQYNNSNGSFRVGGPDFMGDSIKWLTKQLNSDIARQGELPALISARQQTIDDLNRLLDSTQRSSTFSDDQKSFILSKYHNDLQQAQDEANDHIRKFQINSALSEEQKSLLIDAARKKEDRKIEQVSMKIDNVLRSSEMSDEARLILLASYRQQIATKQTQLEALQKELDALPAKIENDRKRLGDQKKAFEPTTHYDGRDWQARKQARWDRMNSGHYGKRLVTFYNDETRHDPDNYWTEQAGSFSADGKTTTLGGAACSPQFDPRNDTPDQRRELAKLLADAEFDRVNCWRHPNGSKTWLNPGYWKNLRNQIRVLQERINNES